jgi:hypothetical protein
MLGRSQLDRGQIRRLQRKRASLEVRIRLLKTALSADNGSTAFIPKETAVTQRVYLSMMETNLERINVELGHH